MLDRQAQCERSTGAPKLEGGIDGVLIQIAVRWGRQMLATRAIYGRALRARA